MVSRGSGVRCSGRWPRTRRALRARGRDFDGIDFDGIDFHGIDFGGIDFGGVDFDGVDFGGIDFDEIDRSRVSKERSRVSEAGRSGGSERRGVNPTP